MFTLPIASVSVGWPSAVVQRPSTMYLYATFVPKGTCALPSMPSAVLARCVDLDHCEERRGDVSAARIWIRGGEKGAHAVEGARDYDVLGVEGGPT